MLKSTKKAKLTFLLRLLQGLQRDPFKLGVRERTENCATQTQNSKQTYHATNSANIDQCISANSVANKNKISTHKHNK